MTYLIFYVPLVYRYVQPVSWIQIHMPLVMGTFFYAVIFLLTRNLQRIRALWIYVCSYFVICVFYDSTLHILYFFSECLRGVVYAPLHTAHSHLSLSVHLQKLYPWVNHMTHWNYFSNRLFIGAVHTSYTPTFHLMEKHVFFICFFSPSDESFISVI